MRKSLWLVLGFLFCGGLTALLAGQVAADEPRLATKNLSENRPSQVGRPSRTELPTGFGIGSKWIWLAQPDGPVYNQTILARKAFSLAAPRQGILRITADSFYRVKVNGRWVADGPCRAWPEHYQYDVLDVSHDLRDGENQIEVVARYYGVGDFHKVPQRAGLLAQLDVQSTSGQPVCIATDASWEVALARAWLANTPKVSVQMEPFEWYDAQQAGALQWTKACELFAADAGPWKNLHARDVALLTCQPFALKSFVGAKVVRCPGLNFCLPAVRLMHPGLIEANHHAAAPCGMAVMLEVREPCDLNLQLEGLKLAIDGRPVGKDPVHLEPGRHLLLAFVRTVVGHDKEKSLRVLDPRWLGLRSVEEEVQGMPAAVSANQNPWCFIPLPEFNFAGNDLVHTWFPKEDPNTDTVQRYQAETDRLLKEIRTPAEFMARLGSKIQRLPAEAMFVQDGFWQFVNRQVVGEGAALVRDPAALMHDTPAATTVNPSPDGDVELVYDLGEQNCGYWTFDLIAPAGTILDVAAVEYIAPDGRIQFPRGNRNGLRYVTSEGVNRFTSLKRRSGRFVFLTLRNQRAPVSIRHFGLIESTYPVNAVGGFACSDARLDNIWAISTRTLKLCMEDTYTDCPLYEQTHWVGDARNESLLGYPVFGAEDLARRCIRITGQSLERYPIAGCQTPSCWDVLLPAWSFLWGISAWDYYWYTGDKAFLHEIYPAVIRNLQGAEKLVDQQGLFAGPFWNMFDWTPIDQKHKAVLHNSMFMVGAIDAALKVADAIGESRDKAWLQALRQRLVAGINRLWNAERKSYPDSVHDDGTVSNSTCQHTSFLSVCYDIVEPANLAHVQANMLNPPEKMVRIGSPFAVLYLYEALEKLGLQQRIVEDIYRNYLPMLESGASTVWESFPSGTTGSGGFPTRSHCHAWSSAPSFFLNRILLGVRPTAPGWQTVQLSPRLSGLTWARGAVNTPRGSIHVAWRLVEPAKVEITCTAPQGVTVEFAPNESLAGKTIVLNGKTL